MTNEELVCRIQGGEPDNMISLWQQNRGMIHKIANRYRAYADIDDLEQEGYLGLCDAVEHYDPAAGVKFITYALYWLKQRMRRYIENTGNVIRIPSHANVAIVRYKRFVTDFCREYGRNPADDEAAYYLEWSLAHVQDIKSAKQFTEINSMDAPIAEDCTIGDIVPDPGNVEEDTVDKCFNEQMSRDIHEAVTNLPKEQADVVYMKYWQQLSDKDIGQVYGCTMQAARANLNKGLRRLRREEYRRLRPYIDEYIITESYRGCGVSNFNRTWTSVTERVALKIMEKGENE